MLWVPAITWHGTTAPLLLGFSCFPPSDPFPISPRKKKKEVQKQLEPPLLPQEQPGPRASSFSCLGSALGQRLSPPGHS